MGTRARRNLMPDDRPEVSRVWDTGLSNRKALNAVGIEINLAMLFSREAFKTKSSYGWIPLNVMGSRRSPAYQKMMKASGNQGEPLNFFTTRHAESRIAKLMTNQSTKPPIPISTTSVPKPLSTPVTGGFV